MFYTPEIMPGVLLGLRTQEPLLVPPVLGTCEMSAPTMHYALDPDAHLPPSEHILHGVKYTTLLSCKHSFSSVGPVS
jgi:hypothetical protein